MSIIPNKNSLFCLPPRSGPAVVGVDPGHRSPFLRSEAWRIRVFSRHFLLVELRRLPNIGSDHFPMLVVLDYDPDASVANEEPLPDAGDEQKADEAIAKGKSNHNSGSKE